MGGSEGEDKTLAVFDVDHIFFEDIVGGLSVGVKGGVESLKKSELVGLNGERCVGAGKGRVIGRVEEEAKEFGACGDWKRVIELGTGQACSGEGDLIGGRRLCSCLA